MYLRVPAARLPHVPYRVEIPGSPDDALDALVHLGALDIEQTVGGITALLPDHVSPETVARKLGVPHVTPAPAAARDSGSVWILSRSEIRIGRLRIMAPLDGAPNDALQLTDSTVFGSGYHPTTALCLEVLDELLALEPVGSLLDVGTGSGILALAALRLGVPHAVAIDVDDTAIDVARENAKRNGLADRLHLMKGRPDGVEGQFPLVVANVLAAPLMDMAPILVRRIPSRGHLILSGIQKSLAEDVAQPYRNLGMRLLESRSRADWAAITLQASW